MWVTEVGLKKVSDNFDVGGLSVFVPQTFIGRSTHDCNLGHVRVEICVQSWLQKGLNINAIFSVREHI